MYKKIDVFIRYNEAIVILDKVTNKTNKFFIDIVSSRKPFGLSTDYYKTNMYKKDKLKIKNSVMCYAKNKEIGYVELSDIPSNHDCIDKWKVYIPRANNIGTELNDDNLNSFVGEPGTICTESFLMIGCELNLTKEMAENLSSYLKTKFVRFMHSLAKTSQDATSKTWRFVPIQDFTKPWTDEELYKKYNLSDEEIKYIEDMIKSMNSGE